MEPIFDMAPCNGSASVSQNRSASRVVVTPKMRMERPFAIQLPAVPLWSSNCKCGSPLVSGVTRGALRRSHRWNESVREQRSLSDCVSSGYLGTEITRHSEAQLRIDELLTVVPDPEHCFTGGCGACLIHRWEHQRRHALRPNRRRGIRTHSPGR